MKKSELIRAKYEYEAATGRKADWLPLKSSVHKNVPITVWTTPMDLRMEEDMVRKLERIKHLEEEKEIAEDTINLLRDLLDDAEFELKVCWSVLLSNDLQYEFGQAMSKAMTTLQTALWEEEDEDPDFPF